jgi:hypothetical protein
MTWSPGRVTMLGGGGDLGRVGVDDGIAIVYPILPQSEMRLAYSF